MIKLSKRLQTIADLVPPGSRIADIGSDHALLPTYLAERGIIAFGIAGEVNEGPFHAADKQIHEAGVRHVVEARLGNGLQVVSEGEVGVVTIAGMGGSLIASILEAGRSKLFSVNRLILQPNVGEDQVREWLIANHWSLTEEHILEEDGKIYEILCAVPEKAAVVSNDRLYEPRMIGGVRLSRRRLVKMGPYLVERPVDVWFKKWELELDKMEMICRQLGKSNLPASREKEHELREEMNEIREVLRCLQKDKPLFK
ncbi:tRNA (adenine(22)-N(1))-methyltransferase [Paenibacillus hamazuiensis]|uniref:tRNA (adenine(22)-N(1))-methyltransferase n=1 Tax=Paenibacillus hamazuiensis TaxID=2936508 RepID=UPI00200D07DF|nr:class I SAM-dependent methyltransferase [Paenibacillus hamazuiensis]